MIKSLMILGCYLIAIALQKQRNQTLDELDKQPQLTPAKLEIHYDCYYLFHNDHDNFLAQGRNVDELIKNIRLRFRNINLNIVSGNPDDVARLETELRKFDPDIILSHT